MSGPAPLEYETFRGARFTVDEGPDGMVASVTGVGLTLQGTLPDDVVGPGFRARWGNRCVASEGQVVSCLVPDRFRGSGYRQARNLVTTSETFRAVALDPIAEALARAYLATRATHLTLRVAVEWVELDDEDVATSIVDDAMRQAGESTLDGPHRTRFEEAVRRRLEQSRLRSHPNLMRVLDVRYVGVLHGEDGERRVAYRTGCDLWL